MSSHPNLDRGKAVSSLTPVRDLAGTKLVDFGRYVLNFYVGIVEYILHETKTGHITRKVPSTTNTTIPQASPPWWRRLPLLQRGIHGSAQSEARNLFERCWARALGLGFV